MFPLVRGWTASGKSSYLVLGIAEEDGLVRLPVHPQAKATSGAATPQVTPQVSEEGARLVAELVGETSRQALQEALGLADREHFRVAYVVPALASGLQPGGT